MRTPKAARSVVLTLAAVLIASAVAGSVVFAASAKPDFALGTSPVSQSVQRGQQASYLISVKPSNGFTGAVSLAVSGLPAGTTASFAPASATPTQLSQLTVSTTASTPIGAKSFTVNGSSGKLKASITLSLTVNLPLNGSFTLSAVPSSSTVPPGGTAVYDVVVTRTGGFTGTVSLGVVGGLPAGATTAFNPPQLVNPAGQSSLQIATSAATDDGTYPISLVASSSGTYQYASTNLVVSKDSKRDLVVGGTVTQGLAPGVAAPVELTISNPNQKPILITNVSVAIVSVSKAAGAPAGPCGIAGNFAVTQYAGQYPFTVPVGGPFTLTQLGVSTAQLPKLRMLNAPANQDACKGATVSLSYAASGRGD